MVKQKSIAWAEYSILQSRLRNTYELDNIQQKIQLLEKYIA